ncbi:hypothetical protein Tco_0923658 [Tanacetum coccineum]|uniref:Uncharacterized protein n=1 Tax=Tanacetum coccineum TaxID=301880 RepID=A0ABQ5D821_9ASTR
MHNNIMAAGSRDRPPMLATGRYAQWRSRFLRYIDTRPNGDALRKCILKGPYTPTIVTTPAVPATEDSPAVPEQTTVETVTNMTPENRAHFESEKEAIHLILTGIATANLILNKLRRIKTNAKKFGLIANNFKETRTTTQQPQNFLKHQKQECGYYSKVGTDSSILLGDDVLNCRNLVIMLRNAESQNRKDFTNHKEKMLLCKQAEKGVQLQAEQSDWLADTDEEIDEQELEAHYSYMAKIQEVPNADSGIER